MRQLKGRKENIERKKGKHKRKKECVCSSCLVGASEDTGVEVEDTQLRCSLCLSETPNNCRRLDSGKQREGQSDARVGQQGGYSG